MATVISGPQDQTVQKLSHALSEYEQLNPGASASLYRQNSASVRVRVVDARFEKLTKPQRHDRVWDFLADRLGDDELQELSVLLLLSPGEQKDSFLNSEFDDPIRSGL